jgi:hypothetical protein
MRIDFIEICRSDCVRQGISRFWIVLHADASDAQAKDEVLFYAFRGGSQSIFPPYRENSVQHSSRNRI